MDSASSSISFSTSAMCCSTSFMTASLRASCSTALLSRSKSLIAYQRCCSSGILETACSSICARVCSTGPEKVCIGTVLPVLAAWTAASAASATPVPLSAEISTILQPSWVESCAVLISSPFFFTISIILMATTTGIPSSVSCVVKYRLRSRLEPSTIFRIASGRSPIR